MKTPASLPRFLRRTLPVLASLALASTGAAQTIYYVSAATGSSGSSMIYGTTYSGGSWSTAETVSTVALSYDARQLGIDSSGNLYIANYKGSSVYEYTSAGDSWTRHTVIGSGINSQALAVGPNGTVYVGATTIYPFTTTNGTSWTKGSAMISNVSPGGDIYSLVADTAGNLYYSTLSGHTLSELPYDSEHGTFGAAVTISTSTNIHSYGMAFDSTGNLWITNNSTNSVYYFTNTGGTLSSVTSTFVTGLTSVKGIAFDAAGNLYVSGGGTGTGYLYRYDNVDGTLSTTATVILSNQANPIVSLVAVGGAAIPEPATCALLAGAGVLALVVLRRRRAR